MLADSDFSTMDPAERVGYLGTFVVFVVVSVLLIAFGIRRLMKRSAMMKQLQYGPAAGYQASQYGAQGGYPPSYGQQGGYPSQYGPPSGYPSQPPYGQPPYDAQGGYQTPSPYPSAPPNPYGSPPMQTKPGLPAKKPPNMAISIVMIVIGGFLLLSTLSAIAQGLAGNS